MDNLWILTEEKPKESVIKNILELYAEDFQDELRISSELRIKPIFDKNKFEFKYEVLGAKLCSCDKIYLAIVSGKSSFVDYLVFKQERMPKENMVISPIMAIEETKTDGTESRNTGIYQRASKFIYLNRFFPDAKKYMLYNEETHNDGSKCPADTIIFGTNMFLTLGINIVGKDLSSWFKKFSSIDELIEFKKQMAPAHEGNTPITITKFDDRIEISGRLAKPIHRGNINHDPNIGAMSLICGALRVLGWEKDIVITQHMVSQNYLDKARGNKFLYICKILKIKLDGLKIVLRKPLPDIYWYYEKTSEKVASILLNIIAENAGMRTIYQNHAGCERGYFRLKDETLIPVTLENNDGLKIAIPDIILHSEAHNEIIIIEGKQLSTLSQGLSELDSYDLIENEYIKPNYPECKIYRYLSIFGGHHAGIFLDKILFYLSVGGTTYINQKAPASFLELSYKEGISG